MVQLGLLKGLELGNMPMTSLWPWKPINRVIERDWMIQLYPSWEVEREGYGRDGRGTGRGREGVGVSGGRY